MLNSKDIITAIKSEISIKGECTIKWCDDAEMREFNFQFRGMDKPTNVLSFPDGMDGYLGDIAISLETIEREADEQGKDPVDHLTHMVVHGILHLLGHDHEKKAEANKMESLEINILSRLGIDNPYK